MEADQRRPALEEEHERDQNSLAQVSGGDSPKEEHRVSGDFGGQVFAIRIQNYHDEVGRSHMAWMRSVGLGRTARAVQARLTLFDRPPVPP